MGSVWPGSETSLRARIFGPWRSASRAICLGTREQSVSEPV